MSLLIQTLRGVVSVLSISASPLYRYPYRDANEAFRGDWKRIAGDVERTLTRLKSDGMDVEASRNTASRTYWNGDGSDGE